MIDFSVDFVCATKFPSHRIDSIYHLFVESAMSHKKNELWKLDYLETKFYKTSPRYRHTKRLVKAKNNSQLLKKLPTTKEEADIVIASLKSEYFERKYYGSYKKLKKHITKTFAGDLNKKQPEEIAAFIKDEGNLDGLITSKLIKILTSTILTTKELKLTPPPYISQEIASIICDKSNISNPSGFFIKFCQNNKHLNNYLSNLWNSKTLKPILQEIEWGFTLIRGNISKKERETRDKQLGKEKKHTPEEDSDDDERDSENELNDSNDDSEHSDVDIEEAYDKFAIYDKLVGDSDNDEEERFEPNANVDYTQVTDEEPSDEESADSFFEDDEEEHEPQQTGTKSIKEKYKLPELANGYFSGGSDDEDDDVDNDRMVKEITLARKNRRGQRARQKIWAKKYGKQAKHIQTEREKVASERQQRQLEYEERERKRQEKARLAMENAPSGSNTQPLGARKSSLSTADKEAVHPSWQAKKLAEEKQKNVKFEGKKIKFD